MSAPDPDVPGPIREEIGPLARKARRRNGGSDVVADAPLTRADYYAGAASWASDSLASVKASQRLAWRVAIAAGALAFLMALALVFLLPLKRTVPYLVTVDRETGYTQAVQTANIANTTAREAATKSALTLYVLARETFDRADYQNNYQRTMRWSAGRAESEYRADWDRANPNSVHTRYTQNTRVRVVVKNVSILSENSAVVRFDTEQSEGAQLGGTRRAWVATVTFGFQPRPLPGADQYLNPLGFQVNEYRRDAETTDSFSLPSPPAPMAPAPLPAPTMGTEAAPGVTGAPTSPTGDVAPAPGVPSTGTATSPDSGGDMSGTMQEERP